ncbi:MAG: hypothetical protein PHX88_10415 [Methanoculleus horonobensis]|nr:hypothetical protein [Methanoculleus horonobensis]
MSSTDTLFSEASSTVDPRAAAALHRLERAVAGEQVPPAMTNLDKTVDWYAAHLREQIRDYLTLAAEDLLARANEGIHILPEVDERRAQEAEEETRKQGAQRAEVAEALAAGYFRVWRGGPDEHPNSNRLTEIADITGIVCPACGKVSPSLDLLLLRWGEILLVQNRPRDLQPDPGRRLPCSLSSVVPARRECLCSCGVTFPIAVATTAPLAVYQGEPTPEERRIMREREQAEQQRQAEAGLHRLDQEREERKRQREQEQVGLRAVVVAGLRSGRVSACIDGTPTETITCPACGKIPPGLDRLVVGYGRVLDDPSFTLPGVEHPVICPCGRAFDLVVSVRRAEAVVV